MLERKMKRVLVIEDDASLGWLLERMLRGKYEVILMNNALDAWSWLTDGNVCDLVITDLNMPSLSGLQLLENIKGSGLLRDLPVMILSAQEDSHEECKQLGAVSCIGKPFEPQMFINEVKRCLEHTSDAMVSSSR
jgi:two-component system, chemotaxis family, chemotaxis protein CheY